MVQELVISVFYILGLVLCLVSSFFPFLRCLFDNLFKGEI